MTTWNDPPRPPCPVRLPGATQEESHTGRPDGRDPEHD
jgi:hypothetical protein